MFSLLLGLFEHWARFLDFYIDNRTIMPVPTDTGQVLWGGTPWDIAQTIGAIATAAAFVFIYMQTKSIKAQTRAIEKDMQQSKQQTELLEKDMNYRFRPWLYPVNTQQPLFLMVKRSKDQSRPGLYIRVKKDFVNEGTFSTRSVNIYVAFSNRIITEYKANASNQSQSAIFPGRTFEVEGCTFFEGLTIRDDARNSLSGHIFISILLEYTYGDVANLKTGSYLGIFRIDRLGYRTDYAEYEHYHPLHFDLTEYAE